MVAPSKIMSFRLRTETFRCVFALENDERFHRKRIDLKPLTSPDRLLLNFKIFTQLVAEIIPNKRRRQAIEFRMLLASLTVCLQHKKSHLHVDVSTQ